MNMFYTCLILSFFVSLAIIFMDAKNVRNIDLYELSPKRQKISVFKVLPTFCIFLMFLFVLVYHLVIESCGVDNFSDTILLSMYGAMIFLALTIYILRYRKANLTRKGEIFRNVRNANFVIILSIPGFIFFDFVSNVSGFKRILAITCLILLVVDWIFERKIKSERV